MIAPDGGGHPATNPARSNVSRPNTDLKAIELQFRRPPCARIANDLAHRILFHVSAETQKEEKWAVMGRELLWAVRNF